MDGIVIISKLSSNKRIHIGNAYYERPKYIHSPASPVGLYYVLDVHFEFDLRRRPQYLCMADGFIPHSAANCSSAHAVCHALVNFTLIMIHSKISRFGENQAFPILVMFL